MDNAVTFRQLAADSDDFIRALGRAYEETGKVCLASSKGVIEVGMVLPGLVDMANPRITSGSPVRVTKEITPEEYGAWGVKAGLHTMYAWRCFMLSKEAGEFKFYEVQAE